MPCSVMYVRKKTDAPGSLVARTVAIDDGLLASSGRALMRPEASVTMRKPCCARSQSTDKVSVGITMEDMGGQTTHDDKEDEVARHERELDAGPLRDALESGEDFTTNQSVSSNHFERGRRDKGDARRRMIGSSMNRTASSAGGRTPEMIPGTGTGMLQSHASQLYWMLRGRKQGECQSHERTQSSQWQNSPEGRHVGDDTDEGDRDGPEEDDAGRDGDRDVAADRLLVPGHVDMDPGSVEGPRRRSGQEGSAGRRTGSCRGWPL